MAGIGAQKVVVLPQIGSSAMYILVKEQKKNQFCLELSELLEQSRKHFLNSLNYENMYINRHF